MAPEGPRLPRLLAFAAAGVATLGGFAGALYLGAWAFDVRRFSTHEQRLTRLLAREPTQEQLEQAFRDEGTLLLGTADGEAALRGLSARFGARQADAVLASGRRFARTQAYEAGDMVYFIHYDERSVMRAFALASR